MQRILLVDDDAAIREIVPSILRDEGYEVATAANGVEALHYLDGHAYPALILLDIMMPIMDGLQFLDVCAATTALPTVPVVVLSAYDATTARLFDGRVVRYMKKPFRLAELLRLLDRWCPAALAGAPGEIVDHRALSLPERPPPADWGGACSYYLDVIVSFVRPTTVSDEPSESELAWLFTRLEHGGLARCGMHSWDMVARIYLGHGDPKRLAERLASYWLGTK